MDYKAYFLKLLQEFVAIPSQSQNEEAYAKALARVLKEDLGMETQLQHVEGKGYNVIAKQRGTKPGAGRTLLLGGHIDTVTPSTAWSTDPFSLTIRGDRAYGLGAADMKGGMAAQVAALKQWIDRGTEFCGTIILAGLCDEERHSLGANAYAQRVLAGQEERADFAIFGEPHYDNIIVGANGKVLLKLTVTGESGHAANQETGVNAIDCLSRFLTAVSDVYTPLYEAGTRASCCVLRMESRYEGYNLNIPEECTAWMNKQLYVDEDAEKFIDELQQLYQSAVGRGTLTISREIPYYPSYLFDQSNEDFQNILHLLEREFDLRPELKINQSVSDGNITCKDLGIPTILLGPYGKEYHKADEYIDLPSAYQCIPIMLRIMEEFFGIQ